MELWGGGNATSLDETLLYSGNDFINDETGFREYTLADMADNYDYLLVRLSAVTIGDGNVISTYIIISPPFVDNVNMMIPFNFWYESQDAYNPSTQNLYYFSGWIRLDGTKLFQVGLRGLGNRVNNFYVEKVIGIKKKSLSTADIAEMAMPSDVYTTITLSATTGYFSSPTNFTAPANGWVEATTVPASNSAALLITSIAPIGGGFGGSYRVSAFVPVKKDDAITIYMNGGTSSSEAKFFYSVGDAKALGLI